MNVTYIYHSSFLVETVSGYLLFDYYKGDLPELSPYKPLYVFASHRHGDHFSASVFNLAKKYPHVYYFLSDDIWEKRVPEELRDRAIFMGPGERKGDSSLMIETLKSTDEGVAFLVNIDGQTIYHAGDLNDWNWVSEPEDNNAWMRKAYREEIAKLARRKIYAAFVVLDPRQGMEFSKGMTWFLQNVDVSAVFPMHCWDDYSVITRYKNLPESAPYRHKICDITAAGQSFLVH